MVNKMDDLKKLLKQGIKEWINDEEVRESKITYFMGINRETGKPISEMKRINRQQF